jgi:hypothetical protein
MAGLGDLGGSTISGMLILEGRNCAGIDGTGGSASFGALRLRLCVCKMVRFRGLTGRVMGASVTSGSNERDSGREGCCLGNGGGRGQATESILEKSRVYHSESSSSSESGSKKEALVGAEV